MLERDPHSLGFWVFVGFVAATVMVGCAHLDEGAINYAKSDIKGTEHQKMRTPESSGKETETAGPEGEKQQTGPKTETLGLMKKYSRGAEDSRIFKDDSVSVHLQQGFIKGFKEMQAVWRFESRDEIRGEIAVVVRTFELKEGEDFNFTSSAPESGRLVYYSDDVRRDQFLNFSFLPVYGPITYGGNPLAVQMYVIELDTENEQLKPLLSQLAGAGAKLYPPASPVLSLLETLGTALLTGNKNDILFRYAMVLHPDQGYDKVDYPVLEAGHYVFVREQNRQDKEDWVTLRLDPEEGRLVLKDGNAEQYRENTYFVLQIQKGFNPVSLDLAQNTFGKFLANLDEEVIAKVEAFKAIADKYVEDQFQIRNYAELRTTLNDLSRTGKDDTPRRNRLAADALDALLPHVQCEDGKESDRCERVPDGLFRPDQVDYLLKKVRSMITNPEVRAKVNRTDLDTAKQDIIDALAKGE